MINIFIANLDWGITSEDLKTTFSAFGPVHYAHVVYDKETKKSKGYGYVEMEDADHAINAINALNGLEVNGRKLDVKIASPKGNRPPKKEQEEKPSGFKKPFNKGPRDSHQGHGRPGGNRTGGQYRGGNQGGGSYNKPNKD
jgi:RNA recognition motif-containing protein